MMTLYYYFGGWDDIEDDQWEFEIDNRDETEFYAFSKGIDYKEALNEDEDVIREYCEEHKDELLEYFEDEALEDYEYWK